MKKIDNKNKYLKQLLKVTEDRMPDFNNLLTVLNNKLPIRPTLFEFFMNDNMYEELTGEKVEGLNFLDYNILKMNAFRKAGFDYYTLIFPEDLSFEFKEHGQKESISLNATVAIKNEKDYQNYHWPDVSSCDFSYVNEMKPFVPEGMKAIAYSPSGLLENVTQLLGYDNMCFLLFDDEKFLQKVFDKVGSILVEYYKEMVQYDIVGALIVNDDWGFNTQTMLSVDNMKKFVVPWHKKMVEVIHASGKKAILHSCGQLKDVMDDIIYEIGFDAKHSFEDNITCIEDAYQIYGDKIALLGGIDLDYIYNNDAKTIQKRCRNLLMLTKERGGYALGTGNSVPHYIESEKYYALIMTALEKES